MRAPAHLHEQVERLVAQTVTSQGRVKPPLDPLLAAPEPERLGLAADLVELHRAGRFEREAWFAAERMIYALARSASDPESEPYCELIRAVGATGEYLCGYPWQTLWEKARDHMVEHGIAPGLHDALRAMQPSMNVHSSDKNARRAIDRALWFESHLPIDLTEDATGCIKEDLRAMEDEERRAWQALLAHGQSSDKSEPTAAWIRRAAKPAKGIAEPELVAGIAAWLKSVAEVPAPRFSTGGVEALRGLVWYATLRRSEAATRAILELASTPRTRGKTWRSHHDRFMGGVAYALGVLGGPGALEAVEDIADRFGKTIAKKAIGPARDRLTRGT